MKKKLKLTAGIIVVVFCIFLGCEKKEKQQDELLLLPAENTESDIAEHINEDVQVTQDDVTDKYTKYESGSQKAVQIRYCVVHICGAVKDPGVYTLEENSRIYQAIEKAGGFREDADSDYLNQADMITDGMKIYVPTEAEVEESGSSGAWMESAGAAAADSRLVNINTAGEELLCTLPGVGSIKAKSIIAYREDNGAFQKIEDIMNVEGIKDGLFQKIKDSITV